MSEVCNPFNRESVNGPRVLPGKAKGKITEVKASNADLVLIMLLI